MAPGVTNAVSPSGELAYRPPNAVTWRYRAAPENFTTASRTPVRNGVWKISNGSSLPSWTFCENATMAPVASNAYRS
jgi:hypothetical protein